MFKVGIVGGTGYTGVELLRLLAAHPDVKVKAITSRSEQGVSVATMFSSLRGFLDLEFTEPTLEQLQGCDLVFFATPNGVAMHMVPDLLKSGIKVVDLSADFRLRDARSWAAWYGQTHACPEFLPEAVYGLPEVNAGLIAQARLVANPGCYPTSVQLALLPLISAGIIDLEGVIADCKSGVSGAGRQAHISSLLPEAGDSFKAYGVSGHRHLPEINQQLSVYAGKPLEVTFVPHLLPLIRGIHATVYARLLPTDFDVQSLYETFYQHHDLVDVMPAGSHPETRSVRGSNICRLAVHRPLSGKTLVILSVIDNLVKGAAGQAVQNMNLMLGLPQNRGLQHVPLMP